ncbi:MAG: RNA polymerase sigma factor [Chloroflexota bacterium]
MVNNEAVWLGKALQGDPQAFTELVEAYQRPVFNLCYRMTGNAQDAEDAAQETFLRAYQNLNRYDRSRPFSTWLLSIAAHYCIDQARKRRHPVVAIEELPVPDLPEPGPGMETQLSRKQEQQRVRGLLDRLDPLDRAAVVLYYWYDFSYDEICQSLSLSLSAVKSRLHRARRLMAETWQQQGTPDGEPAQPAGRQPAAAAVPPAEHRAHTDRLLLERMAP